MWMIKIIKFHNTLWLYCVLECLLLCPLTRHTGNGLGPLKKAYECFRLFLCIKIMFFLCAFQQFLFTVIKLCFKRKVKSLFLIGLYKFRHCAQVRSTLKNEIALVRRGTGLTKNTNFMLKAMEKVEGGSRRRPIHICWGWLVGHISLPRPRRKKARIEGDHFHIICKTRRSPASFKIHHRRPP